MDDYFRKKNLLGESESCSLSQSEKRYAWEDEVNSQGELFHIEHYPYTGNASEATCQLFSQPPGCSVEKDNPGIFGRLMRRRSSHRSFKRNGLPSSESGDAGSIPLVENLPRPEVLEKPTEDMEHINIYIKIDFSYVKIIGRRATAVETFLGLKVMFHGSKIIILDFIPNGPAFSIQSQFQKGDYLHSINGILMTSENIEQYLRNISFCKEVKEVVITVRRTKSIPKVQQEILKNHSAKDESENYITEGFSVLFAQFGNRLGSNEQGSSSEDVLFSYPRDGNMLSIVKGAFLTLLHLLPSLGLHQPVRTSVMYNGLLINIMYTKDEEDVLFMAMPDLRISFKEFSWVNSNVVRCLQFTFQTLSLCFRNTRNSQSLEKFFQALFKRVTNRKPKTEEFHCEFETLFPAAHYIPLPQDLRMQVDDALNELEANDIEIYEDQRLYNIISSSYFYKGYMVCSHMASEDLIDIISLCQQSDIHSLMKSGVKELVFWKEVYLASAGRGLNKPAHTPYSLLPANWYLLIVAKDQSFLLVLLESGGYTARMMRNQGPDVAYIEEALATLDHIIKIKTPQLANKLLKLTDDTKERSAKVCLLPNESNLHSSSSETTLNKHRSLSFRSLDISRTPRSRSTINLMSSGHCNDSLSSDDCTPVIGRRAKREQALEVSAKASDLSDDSDWSKDFKAFDKGQSKEFEDLNIQSKLTISKEDVLLHYVHLDKSDGVLISPVSNRHEYSELLNKFRCHAHQIRKILLNTIAFKKLKAQEVSSLIFNKSLIAIKEHGILFHCEDNKGNDLTYWVVGRIFFAPHLKEVYVCYSDTCPQNMIEIAFRLALRYTI